MKTKTNLNREFLLSLMSYTNSIRPVIWVANCPESLEIDPYIEKIAGTKTKMLEYNTSLGMIRFIEKTPIQECNLEEFLKLSWEEGNDNQNIYLILRDVTEELQGDRVTALIKMISERNFLIDDYYCTIFVLSHSVSIPKEIEEYTTIIDYPLPQENEIEDSIREFLDKYALKLENSEIEELALSFKGLNKYQIRQILGTAYQQKGMIRVEDKDLIMKEKTQFIKKSGLLEVVRVKEKETDIGGLENLKEWLKRKAAIFDNQSEAINYCVDIPKGVLIMGMPGCGKSLTAKVTSIMFKMPLVRLDFGRLLGKYVGESEANMRQALQLAEAISPCVLWIDELEKAFSGVSGSGGNDVTIRLFGQFLTWMQEKESMVFIVATANNIETIPPEFMRKGRFDDIFFVDLPNAEEIKAILKIHLNKRQKEMNDNDIESIAKQLDTKPRKFCGADIESIVQETIERCFIKSIETKEKNALDKSKISKTDIEAVIKESKPIGETLGEQIKKIEMVVKQRSIRSASK